VELYTYAMAQLELQARLSLDMMGRFLAGGSNHSRILQVLYFILIRPRLGGRIEVCGEAEEQVHT
jgi:hypothetical protein